MQVDDWHSDYKPCQQEYA